MLNLRQDCHTDTWHEITITTLAERCRLECDVLFWLQVVGTLTEMVTALRAERRRNMEVSFTEHCYGQNMAQCSSMQDPLQGLPGDNTHS